MISDVLTVIIITLMGVLVIYPASRVVWQSWTARQIHKARAHNSVRRP
jgi:hypothetical protein